MIQFPDLSSSLLIIKRNSSNALNNLYDTIRYQKNRFVITLIRLRNLSRKTITNKIPFLSLKEISSPEKEEALNHGRSRLISGRIWNIS